MEMLSPKGTDTVMCGTHVWSKGELPTLHLYSSFLSTNTDLVMNLVHPHSQMRKLRSREIRYLNNISYLVNDRARITAVKSSEHWGGKEDEKRLATTSWGLGQVPGPLWAICFTIDKKRGLDSQRSMERLEGF